MPESPVTHPFLPDVRITMQWGLVALYLFAGLEADRRPGRPTARAELGWFRRHGVVNGLTGENRGASLRLARLARCLECEATLPVDSTGDHVIAVANGGPAGVENYLPLCGPCNSSKARNDLLAWWQDKRQRRARELPCDALASYARLAFRDTQRRRKLNDAISDSLLAAAIDLRGNRSA